MIMGAESHGAVRDVWVPDPSSRICHLGDDLDKLLTSEPELICKMGLKPHKATLRTVECVRSTRRQENCKMAESIGAATWGKKQKAFPMSHACVDQMSPPM